MGHYVVWGKSDTLEVCFRLHGPWHDVYYAFQEAKCQLIPEFSHMHSCPLPCAGIGLGFIESISLLVSIMAELGWYFRKWFILMDGSMDMDIGAIRHSEQIWACLWTQSPIRIQQHGVLK